MKIIGMAICISACGVLASFEQYGEMLNVVTFSHAVGDGIVDDTEKVQLALTECSNRGLTCFIPSKTNVLVTKELYMWGNANLIGVDSTSIISIQTGNKPYVINIGISGPRQLQSKWTGEISNLTFRGIDNGSGRIIFLWRSENAKIVKNTFEIGDSKYGPISSGNNNAIVENGTVNTIRKNITIIENVILANGNVADGNEGIGLNTWDGARIENNIVRGVADDMIGVHFSKHIVIQNNDLAGVDGRLLVTNSHDVLIIGNNVSRIASAMGQWFVGIALIYVGHEADVNNNESAPTNIRVSNNMLTYHDGAIDQGAAISIHGPRNVTVDGNTVANNSLFVSASGIHILPFVYANGQWIDPDGLDNDNVSRVRKLVVYNNKLNGGQFSMKLIETGNLCTYYIGPVEIRDNIAGLYSFICNPIVNGNIVQ